MILHCTCMHEFQDGKYGKGNRVHNYAPKKAVGRCTVCKNEKPLTPQQIKNLKKDDDE